MFRALRERLEREDRGFTLIELMVVVLIISILIAIAIPTFLGARRRAQDRQAHSNVRNALVASDEYYVDNQSYTDVVATMEAEEPQFVWGDQDAEEGGVQIFVGLDTQVVVLRSESLSGTAFCLGKIATGASAGTYYTSGATCLAADSDVATVSGWSTTADAGW